MLNVLQKVKIQIICKKKKKKKLRQMTKSKTLWSNSQCLICIVFTVLPVFIYSIKEPKMTLHKAGIEYKDCNPTEIWVKY